MKINQYFGYDKNENKVTATTAQRLRQRGAVGQIFHESEEYEPGRGWVIVMQVVNDSGSNS